LLLVCVPIVASIRMNRLRDLFIDGVAAPRAPQPTCAQVVALLVPLLKPAVHLLPPGHWFGWPRSTWRRSCC